MGKISLAAKVTHVPSMFLSELPGQHHGCRQSAIDGLIEIRRRCEATGVDTLVVFDTHWLVNSGFHINASARYQGIYTSNEFPQFIQNLAYDYEGAPALGDAVAQIARAKGVRIEAHHVDTLELEYGTLVPLKYINPDHRMKVLSIAAWCPWHELEDSRRIGEAVREAIEASGCNAAVLASGSLSHRIHDNNEAQAGIHTISNEFYRQVDQRVLDLWTQGRFGEFTAMLPEYARACHGEGLMHDTAMLMGLLGWDKYTGKAEILTDYFTSSGTGQVNAVFPLAA
ncbi:3,4-dihydroxyphenylacetate 2,3-dioxygenase [Microvirga tunisiensis]|uniref:3,4-dihydroxyphenylacetate 2,3-dioxygenase n=1 Tax=Pannonibacter tanglangensis TaxID=2750084 RepID=A0A7X5J9W2_9HYPH|nr:3,4-dihydroxyphenylacetate 2,3-dioxygenase [Pannonibacter sp. XCT-53]NBN78750.1 3,4-dihydroxyphenylacetate 2,3-dioxygenase [Pannonibacter sp. XCT-53]